MPTFLIEREIPGADKLTDEELHATRAAVAAGRERTTELPQRRERLLVQHQMADRLLVAFDQWLDDVEKLLGDQ
jgi:hypothetical protein